MTVVRNDEITLEEVIALVAEQGMERVVISPGPSSQRGRDFSGCHPALCGQAARAGRVPGPPEHWCGLWGDIIRAGQQMHGKTSVITTDQQGVFAGLPKQFTVNRYHSLVIDKNTLPDCLEITATSEDGEIQGVRHKTLAVEGVQFHPESILTEHGHAMLKNFLDQK